MGKPEGKNHLGDPGVDGKIILKWIFRKWDVEVWTAGTCYCGNEPSGSIKFGVFLD